MSWSAKMEQVIEESIVSLLVKTIMRAGYKKIVVDNGDGVSKDKAIYYLSSKVAVELVFSGEGRVVLLYVFRGRDQDAFGWVKLVIGNGCDIISDYSMNIEAMIEPAVKWAGEIEYGKFKLLPK